MQTTGSSNFKLFDPIRNKWVAATPEERVRQALLQHMLGSLAFPKGLVAVEKLRSKQSGRRTDIVAFVKRDDSLRPLLLVECKAESTDEAVALQQVLGYNASFGAPFVCIAHGLGARTFWTEATGLCSVPFLPSYKQLILRRL